MSKVSKNEAQHHGTRIEVKAPPRKTEIDSPRPQMIHYEEFKSKLATSMDGYSFNRQLGKKVSLYTEKLTKERVVIKKIENHEYRGTEIE